MQLGELGPQRLEIAQQAGQKSRDNPKYLIYIF